MVVLLIDVVLRYSSPATGLVGSVVLLSSLPAKLLKLVVGSGIYISLNFQFAPMSSTNIGSTITLICMLYLIHA